MKGLYVYNGGLLTPKFCEIRDLFVQAFDAQGIQMIPKTNEEMRFCRESFDFCLFYDKDISLCMELERQMPVFNASDCIAICDDKSLTASALADWVDMPKQITAPLIFFGTQCDEFLERVGSELSYPVVIKSAKGSFGEQVTLANDLNELVLKTRSLGATPIVFQQFVEANGEDKRIYVADGKVCGAMKRKAVNGDFRANVTNGGIMSPCEVTEEEEQLALDACRGVKALFAGVDVIGKERPVLLEVNSNAHFKHFLDCTGINFAECVANAVLKQL